MQDSLHASSVFDLPHLNKRIGNETLENAFQLLPQEESSLSTYQRTSQIFMMQHHLPQNPTYLCIPTPTTPSTHRPSLTPLTITRTHQSDDQVFTICPSPVNTLCTCQKAAAEKKAGISRTFPRTQSKSGSMRLSDRDEEGKPIVKGPKASEEVVDTGRREYLMGL
jgi:hypothetical protein